jgi:CheY-like chemotaxis protein
MPPSPSSVRRVPGDAPEPSASRRILVVEDNLDTVHSFVLLLRDMGHNVDYAINGYAAIETARRVLPDVVFLDLGLPGMTGFDVCRVLRSQRGMERTKIFSVTAYAQEEYRERALEAGCDVHLVKPVSPGQLAEVLNAA